MKFFKNKKGFTLVELVVVIAILGILAGIAIPRFMDATATARGAKIVADMRTIDSSIMMYNAKVGALPTATSDLTATTETSTALNLLASWPTPPLGEAKIVNTSGSSVKIQESDTAQQAYNIGTTAGATGNLGRAVLGTAAAGKTVDQLLATTSS